MCLVFPDMNITGGAPRKVLFNPRMDRFEVLQIHGLYDVFVNDTSATLYAYSNGVRSREVQFKLYGAITPIVNLVVTVKDGAIDSMKWSNQCIEKVCPFEDCKEANIEWNGVTEKETNCFNPGCVSSIDNRECDTKVYVTWVGNDIEGRYFESDNFRITNLI